MSPFDRNSFLAYLDFDNSKWLFDSDALICKRGDDDGTLPRFSLAARFLAALLLPPLPLLLLLPLLCLLKLAPVIFWRKLNITLRVMITAGRLRSFFFFFFLEFLFIYSQSPSFLSFLYISIVITIIICYSSVNLLFSLTHTTRQHKHAHTQPCFLCFHRIEFFFSSGRMFVFFSSLRSICVASDMANTVWQRLAAHWMTISFRLTVSVLTDHGYIYTLFLENYPTYFSISIWTILQFNNSQYTIMATKLIS